MRYRLVAARIRHDIRERVVVHRRVTDVLHACSRRRYRDRITVRQRQHILPVRVLSAAGHRLVTIRRLVRFMRMRCSVVRPTIIQRLDLKLRLTRRDIKLAFVLLDRVVVLVEVRSLRKLDRILHFALLDRRYASRRLDVARFACDKSASGYLNVRFRQRCSVIRLASALARQNDIALRDAQRSRHKTHTIIIREVAALIQYIANFICLGAVSNVRDSAVRRHGDTEVALLVTVNKAIHGKLIAGQRLAIVRLAIAASRNGQRHSIVDSDDIFRRIRNNRDALGRAVVCHRRIGITSVKCRRPVGRQRFADGLPATLIIRNLYLSTLQVMVDGVIGLIQVEVQLEHRGTVAGLIDLNGSRIHLILMLNQLILTILGLSLVLICDLNSRASFARTFGCQTIIPPIACGIRAILIVELNCIFDIIRRPAARQGHIVCGHGEACDESAVLVPAIKGIAGKGRLACHGIGSIILYVHRTRHCGCACRNRVRVLVVDCVLVCRKVRHIRTRRPDRAVVNIALRRCYRGVATAIGCVFVQRPISERIAGRGGCGGSACLARRRRHVLFRHAHRALGGIFGHIMDFDRSILLPLRLQGHVLVRHDEAAIANRHVAGFPALEGIALLCGFFRLHIDPGILILRVRRTDVPGAAIQVIDDVVASHILGIEIHIRCADGIGEAHRAAGAALISIPSHKGIGYPIHSLGGRLIVHGIKICRGRGVALVIVCGCLPRIA